MAKNRLAPDVRKQQIVTAGLELAEQSNYKQVSAKRIGDAIGISAASVIHHFKTMTQLRRALMRAAVATENLKVIAQGVVVNDPHALKAPDDLKSRAMRELAPWM